MIRSIIMTGYFSSLDCLRMKYSIILKRDFCLRFVKLLIKPFSLFIFNLMVVPMGL
jgi:hypothetical protein